MEATLETYDPENGRYFDDEQASVKVTTRDQTVSMTVEGPDGVFYELGVEVRQGELLVVVSTTDVASGDGSPLWGDSMLQVFLHESEAVVTNAVTGRAHTFQQE